LAKFLQTQRDQRLLIATRDDLAAVYAKNAIEMNRRQSDCIIVSQGLDPNIHGGASEKKEIDPNNRGSAVPGLVATTWTATVTMLCRSPCVCLPARRCHRAR
jgi:hypothetical protein